jgi:hypothetical protein
MLNTVPVPVLADVGQTEVRAYVDYRQASPRERRYRLSAGGMREGREGEIDIVQFLDHSQVHRPEVREDLRQRLPRRYDP